MNSEKIKEIWKDNALKQIDAYSALEIERIILRNARKAMGASFPEAGIFAILIAALLLCVWGVFWGMPRFRTFFIITTVFGMLAIALLLYARLRMRHYSYNKPLKEWLASRIGEFDRNIRLRKKYATLTYAALAFAGGVLLLAFFCTILVLTAGFPIVKIYIPLTAGLISQIVLWILQRRSIPRMIEARRRLQELYDQLEN